MWRKKMIRKHLQTFGIVLLVQGNKKRMTSRDENEECFLQWIGTKEPQTSTNGKRLIDEVSALAKYCYAIVLCVEKG